MWQHQNHSLLLKKLSVNLVLLAACDEKDTTWEWIPYHFTYQSTNLQICCTVFPTNWCWSIFWPNIKMDDLLSMVNFLNRYQFEIMKGLGMIVSLLITLCVIVFMLFEEDCMFQFSFVFLLWAESSFHLLRLSIVLGDHQLQMMRWTK